MTSAAATPQDFSDLGLSTAEAHARFDRLQTRLVPLWKSIQTMSQDPQTIVVVPSMSLDAAVLSGPEMQAYEERFLFLLLLLRQPRAELVYVTSQPIHPAIVDYYLDLLPGVIASHGRRRLHLVAPEDSSSRPLSAKLLERPRLLDRIRSLIRDPERAHLVPYNTTPLEMRLALQLGIPMYGADPRFFPLGSKSGCRRLFAEEGVPHPVGIEGLSGFEEVAGAIASLRAKKPGMRAALVKLNEGVSGEGNAAVNLEGLPAPGTAGEREGIRERLRSLKFELASLTYDSYAARFRERGGVVEELIVGKDLRSPSVQLRVTPLGDVELLSTHDQVLGGPSGQSYVGCRFPANTEYAPAITREAAKIGRRLAKEGVLGRFALDFVVVRTEEGEGPSGPPGPRRNTGWDVYAIELNLRKGGTTHPFLTLQFLTDGRYDPETAEFTAPSGRRKFFIASDHVASPLYRAFTTEDLFDIVVRRGLHFDQTRQTGVIFHMMSALAEIGSVGLTAVGDSHEEADSFYRKAIAALDEEAAAALAPRPLPNA
jgi:pheganomycin biosynthesis PGM1-like protein/pre ATP-grasp domain-containing protein